jgi:putative serine/threonine protein kinase
LTGDRALRVELLKKSFVVPVERLTYDTPYAAMLTYPKLEKDELRKRLKELQKLGVEALEFKGDKHVSNVDVLGKGCVGIVLLAFVGGKRTALKVRRLDADRSRMQNEAEMLQKANSVKVGPKLLGYTGNLLSMQFVEGLLLPRWLRKDGRKKQAKKVLRGIFEQCWRLDHIGLDHGELSHAPKHIIIDKAGRPFIVDFETASMKRKPANVTSICNFLFISGIATEVAKKIGEKDKKAIVKALKNYKKHKTRESFDGVVKACGLYTT